MVSVTDAHGEVKGCEVGLLSGSLSYATTLLKGIYADPEVVMRLSGDFDEVRKETLAHRSSALTAKDLEVLRNPNWLLDQVQYMGYANFIGTQNGHGSFQNVNNMLSYISGKVGATMVYVLPFLSSPFKDAGFDVADFRAVNERFGGDREFKPFLKSLGQKNGKLQMDLILNHISDEHPWAKKVLAGDVAARRYFHILETPPRVVKVNKDKNGLPLSAVYREKDKQGKDYDIERRVIFPQAANPDHPHYRKITDSRGKTLWVYHTFYPFQWDLNYDTPEVLREAFKIVGYWANQGADVLRLDAIPFLFKNQESDPRTMKVVEILRYFLAQVAPATVLIVEACQEPKVVAQFFGKPQTFTVPQLARTYTTTSGAQLAYNFDLMDHIWASLLAKNKSYFLDSLKRTPEPPGGTVWANFLRLHDELTYEIADEKIRSIIRHALIDTGKGTPFRGDAGVSGRLADFLDRDPRRVRLAFSILLSLKGMPIIYYGDEIMARSDRSYAALAASERGGEVDSRDEGRGPVERQSYMKAVAAGNSTPEGEVLNSVSRLVQMRKAHPSLRLGQTTAASRSWWRLARG